MIARRMTETKAIAGYRIMKGEVVLVAEIDSITIITNLGEIIILNLKKPLTTEQKNKLFIYSEELKIKKEVI